MASGLWMDLLAVCAAGKGVLSQAGVRLTVRLVLAETVLACPRALAPSGSFLVDDGRWLFSFTLQFVPPSVLSAGLLVSLFFVLVRR